MPGDDTDDRGEQLHRSLHQGKRFEELFATADDRPQSLTLAQWFGNSGPIRQGRLRLADPEGGWNWVQLNVRHVAQESLRSLDGFHDNPIIGAGLTLKGGYVLSLQPVNKQVLEERRLLNRANRDPLTGLESRGAILSWLDQQLMDDRAQTAQPLALLFCDVDDFKAINDTHGHACGDAVLQATAERITSLVRQRDHAGRIGGDEFLVLLEDMSTLEEATRVAEQLLKSISRPITWADRLITPSCSIGVALHGAGENADLFLRRADRNLYAAKAAGRHCVKAL